MITQIISDRLPIPAQPAPYKTARPWAKALFYLRPDVIKASDGRVKRALHILDDPKQPIFATGEDRITFNVRSCSVKNKSYAVDLSARSCTCYDHNEAAERNISHERICKHRLAVIIYIYGPGWIEQLAVQNASRLEELRDTEAATFEQLCRVINTCERVCPTNDSLDIPRMWMKKRTEALTAHETACIELNNALNCFPFF